jgi:hypothetical protein
MLGPCSKRGGKGKGKPGGLADDPSWWGGLEGERRGRSLGQGI